jgi:hypothetical protein
MIVWIESGTPPVTTYGPFFETTIFLSEAIVAPGTLLLLCDLTADPAFGIMLNHLLCFDYIKTMIDGIQPFLRKRVNYLPIQCNNTRPTYTKHFTGIYGKT